MDYKEICLRDKIGEFLCEFAQSDDRIYVIDSDLAKSTKTLNFKDKYPKRFIEAGIAEASAVSIADGIAAEGGIPFYVNFATFVTGTAWTQVRQSAYANSNVKLIGTYVGMDNGPDGASHHANEDIALMRMIPNMKILIPSSVKELKQSIQIAIEYNGPVYIRVTRDVVPDVELEKDAKIGKAIVVQDDGNDFALIYEGTAAGIAYKGFEALREKGYKGKLINVFSIKPIDEELIENMANKVKAVVTIENHSVIGGLGGAVAEILAKESKHAPLEFVGVEDVFTESGSADEVKSKYGLNINNIIMKTENAMKKSLPISVVPKRNFIQKLKAFFK